MSSLRFTLVSEGSSDRALMPLLVWAIRQHAKIRIESEWADLRLLPDPPKGLSEKIRVALELFPCDLLFVHRDADRMDREMRVREIEEALARTEPPPAVCVVPVRALEAWYLFDEKAIRHAAGNPNGKTSLELPAWNVVEKLSDPKAQLESVIRVASELHGRRRRRVELSGAVHRIASLVRDFSPLRNLPAFDAFEQSLKRSLDELVDRGFALEG